MAIDYDKLQFISDKKIDKVVSPFDPVTTTFTAPSSPNWGSFSVANPFGVKALPTMKWSVDGVNFYEPRLKAFTGGSPVAGATVGVLVSDTNVVFYYTNFTGAPIDYTVIWTLDFIDSDT